MNCPVCGSELKYTKEDPLPDDPNSLVEHYECLVDSSPEEGIGGHYSFSSMYGLDMESVTLRPFMLTRPVQSPRTYWNVIKLSYYSDGVTSLSSLSKLPHVTLPAELPLRDLTADKIKKLLVLV